MFPRFYLFQNKKTGGGVSYLVRLVGVVALEVAEAARSRAAALQSLQVTFREKSIEGCRRWLYYFVLNVRSTHIYDFGGFSRQLPA